MTMGNSSQSNGAFFTLLNLPLKFISLFDVKNHHQQVILPPASAGNDTLWLFSETKNSLEELSHTE